MFKLVAILFLASNPNPIGSMSYNQATFPTKDACSAFVESEAGKAAISAVEKVASTQSVMVKFVCAQTEDNTI